MGGESDFDFQEPEKDDSEISKAYLKRQIIHTATDESKANKASVSLPCSDSQDEEVFESPSVDGPPEEKEKSLPLQIHQSSFYTSVTKSPQNHSMMRLGGIVHSKTAVQESHVDQIYLIQDESPQPTNLESVTEFQSNCIPLHIVS